MITIKVNFVALFVTGLVGLLFYQMLSSNYSNKDILVVAIPTVILIRIYDTVAGLPVFKEKKNGGKNEGKAKQTHDGQKGS